MYNDVNHISFNKLLFTYKYTIICQTTFLPKYKLILSKSKTPKNKHVSSKGEMITRVNGNVSFFANEVH